MFDLNDYEEEVVRFLAERFDRGGNRVELSEFPRYEEVGEQEVYKVIGRFENFHWLESEACSSWHIPASILTVAIELDNPPEKDYWKWVITWFRSKWWSIPVLVIVVGLPALVGYASMIQTLFQWMKIIE